MVSLGSHQMSPGGRFPFAADLSGSCDDDSSLASSVLVADSDVPFKTFSKRAWAVIIIHNIIILSFFVSSILIYELLPSSCYLMYLAHVGTWCLIFLTTCGLNFHHNVFKRFGYLDFHRKTRLLIKLPIFTLSFGNALMLSTSSILQRFCGKGGCFSNVHLHCEDYALLVFLLEFIFLLYISVKYLIIVIKFCRAKSVPDVHHDEVLINCLHSHSTPSEIGFRDGDFLEEMLERQADMIRYLKQHNIHLGKKILKLTAEVNAQRLQPAVPV